MPLNLISKQFVLEVQQKLIDLGFDRVEVKAFDRLTVHMTVCKGVIETKVIFTQTAADFAPALTGIIRIDEPLDVNTGKQHLISYENIDDFVVQLYNFLTDLGPPDFRQFTGLK